MKVPSLLKTFELLNKDLEARILQADTRLELLLGERAQFVAKLLRFGAFLKLSEFVSARSNFIEEVRVVSDQFA